MDGIKLKFKPVVTRIKLNPEQAVLTCNCYSNWKTGAESSNWTDLPARSGFVCSTGYRPGGGSSHSSVCWWSWDRAGTGRTGTYVYTENTQS
jgi:hypothetical protein